MELLKKLVVAILVLSIASILIIFGWAVWKGLEDEGMSPGSWPQKVRMKVRAKVKAHKTESKAQESKRKTRKVIPNKQ